jgi:hypothetical protein
MLSSLLFGLLFVQFMWKQQLQVLQIRPLINHLHHAPHFPERLTEFILNAIALQTLANLLHLLITNALT